MVLEPIESTIQLSSPRNTSKQLINLSNSSTSDGNTCCSLSKRTPRIIGKRGTRNTEFLHPSSLAYSKQDQLICKLKNSSFFLILYF
jgi:hypothetical protein